MHSSKMRLVGIALPGIGGALLAKLACPICWPVYAGMFGSLGVSGAQYASVGLPLGLSFLLLALGSLAYHARERRGYRPLALGMIGAVALAMGELALAAEPLALSGVALLIAASVWNAWPRRMPASPSGCAECAPEPRGTARRYG